MPISLTCGNCGKGLKVKDEWAGKRVKCPQCGNTFPATPGGGGGGTSGRAAVGAGAAVASNPVVARKLASKATPSKSKNAAISISWGPIIGGVCLLLVIAGIVMFIVGPKRVWNQWEQIGSKADDDVTTVMTFALQSYESANGGYDPRRAHWTPHANDDVMFIRPTFVMSMPDSVAFMGTTTEGQYKGRYYVKTGEVDATLDIGGGTSLKGGVEHKVTGKVIHVTGRRKDGKTTAEIDGKKAEIVYPTTPLDDQ